MPTALCFRTAFAMYGCGPDGATAYTLAAYPEGRECVVALNARVSDEADREAIEHLVDTVTVDCGSVTSGTLPSPSASSASASPETSASPTPSPAAASASAGASAPQQSDYCEENWWEVDQVRWGMQQGYIERTPENVALVDEFDSRCR